MSWEMKSLDQLGYVSRGRSRHRPRDAAHLYGGTYPFIQTSDVKHAGLYLTEYSQTYSEEGLAQSRLWESGTLCITIAANIADTAILNIDACFPDSVIGFIPDKDKADARFVKYMFDAHLQLRYKKFTQGAAQDNLSQGKLLSLKFPVPGIHEQRNIADILSAYDDLIENNRRRIQLLEQAARLLYKEWFVHLRFPGHEHVNITNGVPEGWEKKPMGDFIRFANGKAMKSGQEGEYSVYGSNGIIGRSEEYLHENGIIIGRVGAYCGSIEICRGRFWASDNTIVATMLGKPIETPYLFHMLKHIDLNRFAGGAAQPLLTQSNLKGLPVLVPTPTLRLEFNQFAGEIFAQRDCLVESNSQLNNARDLLLPRLMNGEVAV